MASSSWCRDAAEWQKYWTHVQIIFKHWFHDEIRPGVTRPIYVLVNKDVYMIVILCEFCWFVPLLIVMNYCRASFEILTRIRQMAPLFYIINFSKLRIRVKNERTLISAKKSCVDMSSISEVRSCITEWPRFFGPSCIANGRHHAVSFAIGYSSAFLLLQLLPYRPRLYVAVCQHACLTRKPIAITRSMILVPIESAYYVTYD